MAWVHSTFLHLIQDKLIAMERNRLKLGGEVRQIKMMTVASIEASVQIDSEDSDKIVWAADQLRNRLTEVGVNAGVKITIEDTVDYEAEEALKEKPE